MPAMYLNRAVNFFLPHMSVNTNYRNDGGLYARLCAPTDVYYLRELGRDDKTYRTLHIQILGFGFNYRW